MILFLRSARRFLLESRSLFLDNFLYKGYILGRRLKLTKILSGIAAVLFMDDSILATAVIAAAILIFSSMFG